MRYMVGKQKSTGQWDVEDQKKDQQHYLLYNIWLLIYAYDVILAQPTHKQFIFYFNGNL